MKSLLTFSGDLEQQLSRLQQKKRNSVHFKKNDWNVEIIVVLSSQTSAKSSLPSINAANNRDQGAPGVCEHLETGHRLPCNHQSLVQSVYVVHALSSCEWLVEITGSHYMESVYGAPP